MKIPLGKQLQKVFLPCVLSDTQLTGYYQILQEQEKRNVELLRSDMYGTFEI